MSRAFKKNLEVPLKHLLFLFVLIQAEKMRQKEELRREKEAARLKAANERATARRVAREYMELIEDERLELMELAASSKGLSSIVSIDSDTLQQLDMFRGLLISTAFITAHCRPFLLLQRIFAPPPFLCTCSFAPAAVADCGTS